MVSQAEGMCPRLTLHVLSLGQLPNSETYKFLDLVSSSKILQILGNSEAF